MSGANSISSAAVAVIAFPSTSNATINKIAPTTPTNRTAAVRSYYFYVVRSFILQLLFFKPSVAYDPEE